LTADKNASFSGKSSLVLTMLHLLDYTGSVVIDGVDISQISRQELRSRVTTLPQDPVTIQGSVRDNANPFEQACSTNEDGNADDSIIKAALARVGLLDHIESRGGLDSDLAKLGLSQGQMQLFCLARAILHNQKTGSRVVLMDEATSNVDEETDRHMQGIMKEAFAGCTVIIVAHRLDTIKDADLTVELDAGKIVRE
jgi:ABC-type multidrug transport system fused ATPase/permease subunit